MTNKYAIRFTNIEKKKCYQAISFLCTSCSLSSKRAMLTATRVFKYMIAFTQTTQRKRTPHTNITSIICANIQSIADVKNGFVVGKYPLVIHQWFTSYHPYRIKQIARSTRWFVNKECSKASSKLFFIDNKFQDKSQTA